MIFSNKTFLIFFLAFITGCINHPKKYNLISIACDGCRNEKCFRFKCDIESDSTYLNVIHLNSDDFYKISNREIANELDFMKKSIDSSFKTNQYFGAIADAPKYNLLIIENKTIAPIEISGVIIIFPIKIQTFLNYYQDKLIPKIISKAEKVSKLNHVFKTDIP